MRICENCSKSNIKKIWHPYKDFRCSNCNAEYKYCNGKKFDSINDFIVIFSAEIFLLSGLVFWLFFKTWLIFLTIVIVSPIVSQFLKFKYAKIELTGFYEKLRKKDL